MTYLVDERALTARLNDLAAGRLTVEEVVEQLRGLPYEDLGDVKVDHHRELRTGAAEAVYGPGKTPAQAAAAAAALAARASGAVFVTRASEEQAAAVRERIPGATFVHRAGLVVVRRADAPAASRICVVTAGTSDLAVAEEACATADAIGMRVDRVSDVGVAGLHRVLDHRDALNAADCVIVVAGMEGALASAVAGLTPRPVVAVPTSVGYGASFAGLAALLGMLSSCSPGIVVVNIDNGFGAALAAQRIAAASRSVAARDGVEPAAHRVPAARASPGR